jgi:hypothetical protein
MDLHKGRDHGRAVRKRAPDLKLLVQMLYVGAIIYIKDANTEMSVTTHMCAASRAAAESTPHTNMCTQQGPPAVGKAKTVPNEDGAPNKNLLDWRNTATVPVSQLTKAIKVWEQELVGDTNRDFILEGVRHGFKLIDAEAAPAPSNTRNYKSASVANRDETRNRYTRKLGRDDI